MHPPLIFGVSGSISVLGITHEQNVLSLLIQGVFSGFSSFPSSSVKPNVYLVFFSSFKLKMVRHGGCLGLGLAAMGTAKQGMVYSCYY